MTAAAAPSRCASRPPAAVDDPAATLLALLAHPNIASKAAVIRRYDHEIGGATVVRPLRRRRRPTGHADGVVLAAPGDDARHRHRHRRQPVVRRCTTRSAMAHAVVDEAIRNVVAVGADPTGSPCSTTSRGATRDARRRSASWSPPCAAAATRRSPTARRSSSARTR